MNIAVTVDPARLVSLGAWLLAAAATLGSVVAVLRFARDRPPPRGLRLAHGGLAAAGLGVLAWAGAGGGLSRLAVTALLLLTLAATLGVVTARSRRWWPRAPGELLTFAHLSIAAAGLLLLFAAGLAPTAERAVTSPG